MNAQHQITSANGSESCNAMVGEGRGKGGGKRHGKTKRSSRNPLEALTAAVTQQSTMNYQTIFDGLMEMGIAGDQIKPRENVFTFAAWKALGRVVRKGQHGVRVCVFIPRESKNKETGEITQTRMPASTTVFHISQTDPLPTQGEDSTTAQAATV
jgi:antirestriction protein ArdC